MKVIKLCFLVTVLMGCAGAPYSPPTDGPMAHIVIPSSIYVNKFGGELNQSGVRFSVDNGKGCSKFGSYMKPKHKKDETIGIMIHGGKKIFIRSSYKTHMFLCTSIGSFYSEPNVQYTVIPGNGRKYCSLTIIGKKGEKELAPVELSIAYVDAWSGLKVCTNKNDL